MTKTEGKSFLDSRELVPSRLLSQRPDGIQFNRSLVTKGIRARAFWYDGKNPGYPWAIVSDEATTFPDALRKLADAIEAATAREQPDEVPA